MEEILQQCPLFRGVNLKQITELLDKFNHRTKQFEAKDFVIFQNDVCENLMLVLNGKVQAQMVDSVGKLIIVEELGTAELLAPAFIFSEENKMPVSLLVIENTEILYFRKQVFMDMMQANQMVLLNFLRMISNRTKFLSDRLKFYAFKSLKNKIAFYLLEQYKTQHDLQLKINHTQQELADRFGVTRPSLARSLAELDREGVIEFRNKDLKIRDISALKKLAQ